MTVIGYRGGVAIGEISIYVPAFLIAIFLSIRHGFGRSSGWRFIMFFCLVRVVGAGFQLDLLNHRTSKTLVEGTAILETIGISPLELAALGMLSRVSSSMNKSQSTFIKPSYMKFLQLLVTGALILAITGAINSSSSTGTYKPKTTSKIAMVLFIVGYAGIAVSTLLLAMSESKAEAGEKRVLFAVWLSNPFLLVRIIYSSISIFHTGAKSFNALTGSVTLFLCMAVLMELIVVIIYEGMGITLKTVAPTTPWDQPTPPRDSMMGPMETDSTSAPPSIAPPSKLQKLASTLGRRTIIGRIVTRALGNSGNGAQDKKWNSQGQYPPV